MPQTTPSPAQLETLCVERRRSELLSGIKRRLRYRVSEFEFSQCMEWLARAGMFQDLLRLALPTRASALAMDPGRLGVERTLWIAWSWAVLGAHGFSRELFERLSGTQFHSRVSQTLAANLMQAHGDYEQALAMLERGGDHAVSAPWIWNRLLTLLRCQDLLASHADALMHIGRFKQEYLELSRKNAIHLRALEGYFKGAAGNLREGIAILNELLDREADLSGTHPRIHTYAQRVLGQHLARSGDKTRARQAFAKALRSTRDQTGGRAPHAELEVLVHYAECGLANSRQIRRLCEYPGTAYHLSQMIFELDAENDTTSDPQDTRDFRWIINTRTGELIHKGRIHPEAPRELLLAAFLLRADITGLSLAHACSLLWPGEAWNWIQLQERLPKLIQRLRKIHGIPVVRRDDRLHLGAFSGAGLILVRDSVSPLPSFLAGLPGQGREAGFAAHQVAQHFQVTRRQAVNLIRRWLDLGWISRTGKGPGSKYRVAEADVVK